MDYIIKNATIVNEGALQKASLYVKDGRIEAIADNIAADTAQVIDAEGCYLLPGIIDTHVHFRDGGDGSNPAGDFHTESRAAALGGVTSVVDMPNTNPQTTSLALMEDKKRMAAEKSTVNYGFMIGATNENIDDLLQIPVTQYAAIKLFLGSSTGNMLVNNPERLDQLFEHSQKLIVAHCEEEANIQANMAEYKHLYQGTPEETAALHPKVRDTAACYVCTYKAIERARKFGTHLHIAHITSANEVDLLSNQELDVKNVTAEVTPNHLWFDDRDYAEQGNKIKCNPAIKSNADRMALWAALYDGRIDTIGTDHAPHTKEAKSKRYFDAPSGIPSIQHSLQMMVEPFFNSCTDEKEREELIKTWLPVLVTKMCHNPATLFGIEQRGFIRQGYQADLVLVNPNATTKVTADSLQYKCGWSPLEGCTFHSQISHVLINGTMVVEGGRLTGDTDAQALTFCH